MWSSKLIFDGPDVAGDGSRRGEEQWKCLKMLGHRLWSDPDLLERTGTATRGRVACAGFVASNALRTSWTSLVAFDSPLSIVTTKVRF